MCWSPPARPMRRGRAASRRRSWYSSVPSRIASAAARPRTCPAAPSRGTVRDDRLPRGAQMNAITRIVVVSMLSLAASMAATVAPALAQAKSELTVALSSFSAETLDPVLQGHNVKYYLSLMFDYLVGTTPDGQPSQNGGLAQRWENSADHKRWTFHLRKGVKFHDGTEMTSDDVKFSLQRAFNDRATT